MRKGIKVALDPTPRQEQALWSHAGAARFAFNRPIAYSKPVERVHARPRQGQGRLVDARAAPLVERMET